MVRLHYLTIQSHNLPLFNSNQLVNNDKLFTSGEITEPTNEWKERQMTPLTAPSVHLSNGGFYTAKTAEVKLNLIFHKFSFSILAVLAN